MEFEHLQVGDKVFISDRYRDREAAVSRLTKTLVIVKESHTTYENKFRKTNGRQLGGSTWGCSYLREYSQERADEIAIENTKKRSINKLKDYQWGKATNELLAEVVAILDKHKSTGE